MTTTDTKPADPSWSHGEPPVKPRSSSTASGVITLLVTVFVALCLLGGWVAHHRSVTVTTCDQVLQTCYQTSYPVQPAP
jgi:hypothetical protein